MTNTLIDLEEAKALLDHQVAVKGADYITLDHVAAVEGADYITLNLCTYFKVAATDTHENPQLLNEPSCIVGHVFHALGVSGLKFNPELNGTVVSGLLDRPTDHSNYLLEEFGLDFTKEAVELLRIAQVEQDQRSPWGDAVQTAKRVLAGGCP